MTLHLLHLGGALLCWVALVIKAAKLRSRPRDPGMRSLCAMLLGLSLALTVGWPPTYAAIDWAAGIPNLAKLIQHVATMGACIAIAVMYAHLDRPDTGARAGWRIGLGAAVGTAMAVLFIRSPVDVSEPLYFADRYSTVPYIPQYMFLFLVVIAVVCADIAASTWRHGRRATNRPFRYGVHLLSAAAAVGVVYAAFKGLYIVARFHGAAPPVREGSISSPLALGTVVLATIGLTLPKAAKSVAALRHRLRCRRTYRKLYPLWSDLRAAIPEIALHRPGFDLFDIEYRLYRRVIEIGDGILALRSAPSTNVALVHTLERHRPPADHSLDEEVRWPTRVADDYRRGQAECDRRA